MNKSTLGLIETYGFVGAVEALDVSLKASNVELVSCEFIKGGIVTILITGDVASVKASVEASAAAVEKLGTLRNTHVIARTDEKVIDILSGRKKTDAEEYQEICECVEDVDSSIISEVFEEKSEAEAIEDLQTNTANEAEITQRDKSKEQPSRKLLKTREELEEAKVTELRSIARELKIKSLTKKQIKYGKKEQLIEAILSDKQRR